MKGVCDYCGIYDELYEVKVVNKETGEEEVLSVCEDCCDELENDKENE